MIRYGKEIRRCILTSDDIYELKVIILWCYLLYYFFIKVPDLSISEKLLRIVWIFFKTNNVLHSRCVLMPPCQMRLGWSWCTTWRAPYGYLDDFEWNFWVRLIHVCTLCSFISNTPWRTFFKFLDILVYSYVQLWGKKKN